MGCLNRVQFVVLQVSAMVLGCADYVLGSEHRKDFRIEARICEAMEGGPFIVEVTYIYQGKEAIEIIVPGWIPRIYVNEKVPSHWEKKGRPRLLIGPKQCVEKLLPGQKWAEILYLHHYYSNITSGRARIELTWNVRTAESKDKPIASPRAILYVNVPPANPENLDGLRRRLAKRIRQGKLSSKDREYLVNQIHDTRHKELEPVGWQLLETNVDDDLTYRLCHFVYDCSKSPELVNRRLVKMAMDPSRKDVAAIFDFWWARRIRIPLAERIRLCRASNLWTRTLVYVTYPEVCHKDWIDALMRKLRNIGSLSLSSREFERTLRDLDDDSFLVREKASASLEQLGERVVPQLHQALQTDLPPEAKRRVRFILERIAAAKKAPEWKPILDHLSAGVCDRDAALAVLRALAKGAPDAALTKAAVASLNKLSTPKRGDGDGQR